MVSIAQKSMIILTVTVVFVWFVTFMCCEPVVTLCGDRTLRQKLRRKDKTLDFIVLNVLVNVDSIIPESCCILRVTLSSPWHYWTIISSLLGNNHVSFTDAQRQGGDVKVPIYERWPSQSVEYVTGNVVAGLV